MGVLGGEVTPVFPDPVFPDPVLPDPVLPDPVLPDPVLGLGATPGGFVGDPLAVPVTGVTFACASVKARIVMSPEVRVNSLVNGAFARRPTPVQPL
jgi:hypothetical protein